MSRTELDFKLSFEEAKQLTDILEFTTCFVNSEHAQPAFELNNLIRGQITGNMVDDIRASLEEWKKEHGDIHQYREKQKAEKEAKEDNPSQPWWMFWRTA